MTQRLAIFIALVALSVLGMGAAIAPSALGKRAAMDQERAEMAAATKTPPECVDATISTIDPRWGVLARSSESWDEQHSELCSESLGTESVLLTRPSGTWTDLGWVPLERQACPINGIPTAVARELGVCERPRTYVRCASSFDSTTVRVHPARCNTSDPSSPGGTAFGFNANLTHLRWRHWGRSVATATGIELGFHVPLSHIRVRVRAYRRKRSCDVFGHYIYTRWRITSRYGSLVVRHRAC